MALLNNLDFGLPHHAEWGGPAKLKFGIALRVLLPVLAISLCPVRALADDDLPEGAALGPIITSYGPTFAIEDRDVALEDAYIYRAVFDASRYSGEPEGLNATLVSAARFLNMHGRNGVAPEDMQVAIVLHGEALKAALTDEAYHSRYGTSNPNLGLIQALHDAGVELFVCGQSMGFRGIARDELSPHALVALSAMTMLTILQSRDYALLP